MGSFWLKEQLVLEYSTVKTRKVEDKLLKGFFVGGPTRPIFDKIQSKL